ncbi:AAA family ATPase [Escherichia coli]|nr:AAA family ATPase [Escherichia coli]
MALIDGPFVNAIKLQSIILPRKYVVIIEEINRGNPAQIFGETLTLMEADKRTPTEALSLSYPKMLMKKYTFLRIYISSVR